MSHHMADTVNGGFGLVCLLLLGGLADGFLYALFGGAAGFLGGVFGVVAGVFGVLLCPGCCALAKYFFVGGLLGAGGWSGFVLEAGGEPGDGGFCGVAGGEEVADVGERVELNWRAGLAELFVIGLGDCGKDELV